MSLFRRRKGRDQKDNRAARPVESPVEPSIEPPVEPPVGPKEPTLAAAKADGAESSGIKTKVQAEVCAIMARTILELIQSSQARAPSMDELVRRQAINRLYAEVLYDLMAGGAAAEVDPAQDVLAWAREAMDDWGRTQRGVDAGMARAREDLAQSILAALEAAGRFETLRKAARHRLEGTGPLSPED